MADTNPRVLIVEARFYDHLSDALLAGAKAALAQAGASVDVVTVPGALEIPGAIALAASGIGVKSLSNLIELLILSVLLAGILSLRLFLDTEIPSRAAWIGFLVGCLSSVAVYFAVPLLPE